MLKALLPATILSAFVASAAIAAPAGSPTLSGVTASTTDNVIQARDGRRHGYHRHRYHRHGYRSGRHYSHAPRGWHRHHYRPHDWRTRGCITVGPIWFCP